MARSPRHCVSTGSTLVCAASAGSRPNVRTRACASIAPPNSIWFGTIARASARPSGANSGACCIKLGTTPLEGDIATLDGFARGLNAETFAPRLRAAFERELGLQLECGVPDALERGRTKELGPRFVDPDFVRRR
jgi:hypothetical protein